MTGRSLAVATAAALTAPHVATFILLELGFDSGPVYLASTAHDVEYDSKTWRAAQGIGTIEPTTETSSGARGLTFTLSASAQAAIAGALTEDIQGRPVVMKLGIVDNGVLRVDPNVWSGYLDVMTISDTASNPVIRVTAEHAMLAWTQPGGQLFSHQDQQDIDPTDMFFEFAAEIAETTIVWPGKEALL